MITYIEEGNIFESDAHVLVNPINCLGVSGKGLARKFAQRFKDNQDEIAKLVKKGMIKPGVVFLYDHYEGQPNGEESCPFTHIANFPTKVHWKHDSQIRHIYEGLVGLRQELVHLLVTDHTSSVAIPALGCGEGHLPWEQVKNGIEYVFKNYTYDLDITVYTPRE